MQANRVKHELQLLEKPPVGIQAYPKNPDDLKVFEAKIQGTENTPYEGGIFTLEVTLTDRYPFEPPIVKFITPIYHPNIDTGGRICLNVLNSPPKGNWAPSLNISTLLLSIQQLMNDPNPDDPLMVEITNQYRENKQLFLKTAREWTKKHALDTENIVKPQTKQNDSDSDSDSSDDESSFDEEETIISTPPKKKSTFTLKRKSDSTSEQDTKKIKQ